MAAFEIFHSMKHKKGKKGVLAMKLDMSKVYDRVEWNILEATMQKMGFNRDLVNLVMRCVRSVSYEIVVNGPPHICFLPGEGTSPRRSLVSVFIFAMCGGFHCFALPS